MAQAEGDHTALRACDNLGYLGCRLAMRQTGVAYVDNRVPLKGNAYRLS
uniref:Uncharacterized protein n=1 Tax=uncultured bacterium contig00107 TaxID=1181573 RepID=A0A806KPG8_9BACT|nr:hypothetical protein [uncultured bacterium contig00107]